MLQLRTSQKSSTRPLATCTSFGMSAGSTYGLTSAQGRLSRAIRPERWRLASRLTLRELPMSSVVPAATNRASIHCQLDLGDDEDLIHWPARTEMRLLG